MDIHKLLDSLTIEEKIGQMLQIAPFFFIREAEIEVSGHVYDLHLTKDQIFNAGSVLGIRNAEEMIKVQKLYLERNKHQIPLMFMADIIHGYETIFPVPLALSCSWNPRLAEEVARISALEAQTAGIHVTFSPMADLSRDPRWGRVVEGFGEDVELIKAFVKAMVKGYQQDDLTKEGNVASCVKHFAGYGASEAGRDYNTVDLSRLSLYQRYLPAYEEAIKAGAKLIMTSFNTLDGIPSTVNSFLLRDILRDQWKFDGLTISDYDSLHQVIAHGVAENDKEAAELGIIAGLDIEMASSCYIKYLKELVLENKIDIKLVDEAVLRILELKKDLGLFDNPYKGANIELEERLVHSKDHLERSKEIATESVVLLKNNHVLPLKPKTKIALVGPYATSNLTNGPWSWHGKNELNTTLEQALNQNDFELVYVSDSDNPNLNNEDLSKIKKADVIIIAIGEHFRESGEAHSRSIIDIPRQQDKWVKLANELNIKSVTVLYNGRPLILESILESDAILEAWFLGSMTSEALVELIKGDKNPSGKLTMSFPRNGGQIPIYYDHLNTGRPKEEHVQNEFVSYYLDVKNTPLYPFGYGLSYSNFVYQSIHLNQDSMTEHDQIKVKVKIHNQSDYAGYETIQLYIQDHYAKISRPVMELKDFKKVWFDKNEEKEIEFEIGIDQLNYVNQYNEKVFEEGKFSVMVGTSSIDYLKKDFYLVKEVIS